MGREGLQKNVVGYPLVGSVQEKFAKEAMPEKDLFRTMQNVEIDKIGRVNARAGHSEMSDTTFGPDSPGTLGTVLKLGARDGEIWAISDDSQHFGSGGGVGNAGQLLWSYSPEFDAWRAHGQMSRVCADRFAGFSNANEGTSHADCCFVSADPGGTGTNIRIVAMVYAVRDWGDHHPGLFGRVYDATTGVSILEGQQLTSTASQLTAKIITVGRFAVAVWFNATVGLSCSVYDMAFPALGFQNQGVITTGSTAADAGWGIGTDGTTLFVLRNAHTTDAIELDALSVSESGGTVTVALLATHVFVAGAEGATTSGSREFGVSWNSGRVHATWVDCPNDIARYGNVAWSGAAFSAGLGPINVDSAAATGVRYSCINVALNANDVCVFYADEGQINVTLSGSDAEQHTLKWRWVKTAATSPGTRLLTHSVINVAPTCHPFIFDSRVFIPVVGIDCDNAQDDPGLVATRFSQYGHVLCAIHTDPSTEDNNAATGFNWLTMFPTAEWARDQAKANIPAGSFGDLGAATITLGSPGDDSDRYVCTVRELRQTDAEAQADPSTHGLFRGRTSRKTFGIDIMRLTFEHPKRWKHVELAGQVLIACGLPMVYDGLHCHESGFVFRPAILGFKQQAGTSIFQANDTLIYRATYEWESVNGERWFSDTSYPRSVDINTVANSVTVCVRLPPLTSKPLGGRNFAGRVKCVLYRSLPATPDRFDTVGYQYADPFGTTNLQFVDVGVDLTSTEKAYIFGGELDNALAPPCRVICRHKDRIYAFSTFDGYLYYTKPMTIGRGIEWVTAQRLRPPQRGMALASLDSTLVVGCDKAIYILQGQHPAVTGIPAGQLELAILTTDFGVNEENAAWTTPRGALLRTDQGLWLVTPQLGIAYVGGAVETTVKSVARFIDGLLDVELGRLRLLALMDNGAYKILNWWYDTDRWTIDTLPAAHGAFYTSLYLEGETRLSSDFGLSQRSLSELIDNGQSFTVDFETGDLVFGELASVKRVWRSMVEYDTTKILAGTETAPFVTVECIVDSQNTSSHTFSDTDVLNRKKLRLHHKYQKGSRYRLRVSTTLTASPAVTNRPSFYGIGFELGLRRGLPKTGAAASGG